MRTARQGASRDFACWLSLYHELKTPSRSELATLERTLAFAILRRASLADFPLLRGAVTLSAFDDWLAKLAELLGTWPRRPL